MQHFNPNVRFWRHGLSILLLAACGGGGGDRSQTVPVAPLMLNLPRSGIDAAGLAVIVAEGDPQSEAISAYYQAARGIPAANIIHVKLATGADQISAADFAALKAKVDAKLPAAVQATLLTWTAPSRVAGSCTMSITSAMAFGFDAKYCGAGCVVTAASPYFDSESGWPWLDFRIRPSMLLGAATLVEARGLIDRGVSADASFPLGEGFLLRTRDSARSVRYTDYLQLPPLWAGRLLLNYLDNPATGASDSLSGKSGVLFYFTGLAKVPEIASNSYRPGAAADHLTSYGGLLPSANGQMPITSWLAAGATASFGTVAEPCNFTQKFSRASVLIDHYYRGETLIEAYWKAVEWPGQGLFVGEPLARPFADKPDFRVANGEYLISSRMLRPGSSYALEYREAATGVWIQLADFTPAQAQAQTLHAPLAPAGASQLRWLGPCPGNIQQQCVLSQSG